MRKNNLLKVSNFLKFPTFNHAYIFTNGDINSISVNLLVTKIIFLKYNQSTLNRLEKILDEAGYIVRYERGSFQSGYCILEDKKVVVLNKFLIPEGRINTLIDIIPALKINYDLLTHDSQKLHDEIMSKTESLEK